MNKYLKIIYFAPVFLFTVTVSSCEKEQQTNVKIASELSIDNYDKLHQFVSVISGIPKDKLVYSEEKEGFILPNTSYFLSLEDAQKNYSIANEYKLNFEKIR